jgi:hypothetical protein
VTWLESARAVPLLQVAAELQITLRRDRLTPCPGCGADRRSSTDDRGPVFMTRDLRRWTCGACGVAGSVLDMAAAALRCSPTGPEVRAWFAARGWCPPAQDAPPVPMVAPRPPPEPPPSKVPASRAEGGGVWAWGANLDRSPVVTAYLRQRAIDPAVVLDEDMARGVPDGDLPAWAEHWRHFSAAFVLPLFDARGELAGLQARSIAGPRKSLRMRGVAVSGLLLATRAARSALSEAAWPSWWAGRPTALEVVEGEPDFLTRAVRDPSAAVLGIPGEGAWSADVAGRVPAGSLVDILTHQDAKGDKYSNLVAASLLGRCRVRRARWAA